MVTLARRLLGGLPYLPKRLRSKWSAGWLILVLALALASCRTTATPAPIPIPPTATPAPIPPTATPTTTAAAVPHPANPQLFLASTTSTHDSGLMDVLLPIFQQQTGYQVKPSCVGSGQAITMAQQGNADVLLVHAPASEVKFMQAGYGIDRKLVMHSDFIIVGPPSDPAGIRGMTSAVGALKKIEGAKANFYSRGDNSGTDQLEKSLWAKAGITVTDGAQSNPRWYYEANVGMGQLLLVASEKNAYTMSDRATYLANKKNVSLDILVQGDPGLLNIYHVIQVNLAKFPNVKINVEGAKAFADFMVAPATQQLIAQYGVDKYGEPLFFPDAGKTEAQLGSQ